MSQQHGNRHPTDELPDEGRQALAVLRQVWDAQDQTSADIDESCGNTKACKRMGDVGFAGYADEDDRGDPTSVGSTMRAGWKNQLEREGKLDARATSVRDLVMGQRPKQ
jgi:hypothetical protein